jgi:hypothetical protein
MLRARSSGVAQFSLHTKGDAIDFFIPDVPLEKIRNAGLRLQRGGVGFYPTSGSPFIHMDVGSIRHWPRLTHDQLVKVFPDGRTVHIPTDGQPLPGYSLALADVERRGDAPSHVSLAYARGAGAITQADEDVAERSTRVTKRSVIASIPDDAAQNEPTKRSPAPIDVAALTPPTPVATVAIVPMPKHRPTKQIAIAMFVPTPKSRPALPTQIASADPIVTASAGPVLAYAAEPAALPVNRTAPMGAKIPKPEPVAEIPEQPPLAKSARLSFAQPIARFDNPWLRATVMTPNVSYFLTALPTGRLDTRQVRDFLHKPRTSVVMMSFSADPQNGLRTDMFSGQAVVFLATLPSTTRTAALGRP